MRKTQDEAGFLNAIEIIYNNNKSIQTSISTVKDMKLLLETIAANGMVTVVLWCYCICKVLIVLYIHISTIFIKPGAPATISLSRTSVCVFVCVCVCVSAPEAINN